MIPINEIDMKIKIPGGYFVCLPTGATDDYPGLGIFFLKTEKQLIGMA